MNETHLLEEEDAPINIDIDEGYEALADILFKDPNDMLFDNGSGKRRGPNGETETVMIVKDHLLTEFDKKAKYVVRDESLNYNGDTKTEIMDMQQQLAAAISVKTRKGEKNDVTQLIYSIKSTRSKIKKIALDNDHRAQLYAEIKPQPEKPQPAEEEKSALIKKGGNSEEEKPSDQEGQLRQEFMLTYLTAKTGDDLAAAASTDFIISFNNKHRLIWDSFILLLAIWNCIEMPLDIAFEPKSSVAVIIINYVIDLMFYIDIIVMFRTSFITFDGHEIKEAKSIAWQYMFHGTFFLDLISVLPFYEMIPGDQKAWQLLGMLKLIRIKRLPKLIANLDIQAHSKAYFEVVQIIFFLILFIHLLTCLWFFSVQLDHGIWLPPFELASNSTLLYTSPSLSDQYIPTFYVAVNFLTGSELLPLTDFQLALAFVLIMISYAMNGSIFGYMKVLLHTLGKDSHATEMQVTEQVMIKAQIPEQMKEELRRYEDLTKTQRARKGVYEQFVQVIGPKLRIKIGWSRVEGVFAKNHVLNSMVMRQPLKKRQQQGKIDGSDFASLFMKLLEIKLCNPDYHIVTQGDMTADIYYVAEGEVSVSFRDRVKQSFPNFRVLQAGDHFGEISTLFGCPRTATVVANDFCTLAVLSKENYQKISGEIPELHTEMKKFIMNAYNDDEVKLWAFSALLQLPFLQGIEEQNEWTLLHKIFFAMTRKVLNTGELLFYPGMKIQHMTVVQDGIIDIYTIINGKEFLLEQLMRGSILNYRCFFLNDVAAVYARAATSQVSVLQLTFPTLQSLSPDSPLFERKLLQHQLRTLNQVQTKSYHLDYLRRWHSDFISPKQASVAADVSERATLMKLMVMRRVEEIRRERAKPRLADLLMEVRGRTQRRVEVRKKMWLLYGQDMLEVGEMIEEKVEKREEKGEEKEIEEPTTEGQPEEPISIDQNEEVNPLFEDMKARLAISLAQLEEESKVIQNIKGRIEEELAKTYPDQQQ